MLVHGRDNGSNERKEYFFVRQTVLKQIECDGICPFPSGTQWMYLNDFSRKPVIIFDILIIPINLRFFVHS